MIVVQIIKLCLVVTVSKLFNSIADFFKELPQFVVKTGPISSNRGTYCEIRLVAVTKQRIMITFCKAYVHVCDMFVNLWK
ncbi:hypothetical protein VNO77_39348 [Canavalia gladiata]|uniref:Secreted protein n=1 Tax=Canavalia gladiata TaxID=3824 RepID=A0AAN9PX24_CANGL